MPYTKKDYPNSMKNLDTAVRDKAIDILNAMLKDGYEESHAIPIAISQAEKRGDEADDKEKSKAKKKDVTEHKKSTGKNSARLQDADVEVSYNHDKTKRQVKSVGASHAEGYYDNKKEAEKRAKEIATNKGSKVITKTKEESK